jgi:alpha-glucuronidase
MCFVTKVRSTAFCFIIGIAATTVFAYDGSQTFLHYYAVPASVLSQYQSVCQSLVVSDSVHDTLKHALAEFDTAMPKLLGGSKLPRADAAGAIVLAEQGTAPVASAGIDYSTVTNEGFIIRTIGGKTYITGKTQVGVLRGAFHFLRLMQTCKSISSLNIVENPYFAYRVLDHWYNHYGSGTEGDRLYGGNRVFRMENFGALTGAELTRVINYCRMAAALGLNGMCPDNVNTYQSGGNGNYKCLEVSNLVNERVFANLIGTYGLKYYLSVSYASPRLVTPKISSADAYKVAAAKQWWFDKVDTVRKYISNFGGFLMKADSEGEEGPRSSYGETQSQGANPIAEALRRYGHILIWRTFIYDTSDPDFAVNQSVEFAVPAQTWDTSVVLRMKDGPRDFQMIEPPHQLLAMTGVRKGMEFQITQEYTGQATHLCWLVPRWKQILDYNITGASTTWSGAAGTLAHQLLNGAGSRRGGVWAISNLSDATNWTGHFLHQANYYGYGRLAWNPNLSVDSIADEWIRCSVDNGYNYGVQYILKHMLLRSWPAYTDYTIGHSALMPALGNNNHYTIDFDNMRNIGFYTDWFMDFPLGASGNGIGVERSNSTTSGGTVHNNFANLYHTSALASTFTSLANCPEDYILFFHHLLWGYVMKGGMTLIQQLHFEHYRGIHRVYRFRKYWNHLNASTTVDAAIYSHVLSKLNTQFTDASTWAGTFRTQFGIRYTTQVPCNLVIVTPDTTTATTAAVGANVNLSAVLRSQNNAAVTGGTFNWSVVEPGATLTAATGTSTVFSASAPGIYTVKLWDSRWPNQFEDELIFVGTWTTGTKAEIAKRSAPLLLKIIQGTHCFVITSPIAGKISIVSLQGRVVKSIHAGKAVPVVWNTKGAAKGLYLLTVQNGTQALRGKLIVQ